VSRIRPIVKREFTQTVTSRAFLVGTILGPLLIAGIFGLQFIIIMNSGGGEHRIAIIDASGNQLGARVAEVMAQRAESGPTFIASPEYALEVGSASATQFAGISESMTDRINAEELDGFLWIPPGVLAGVAVAYDGSNATNSRVTGDLQFSVQRVVQSERLRQDGIDEARLGEALQPVAMNITKTGVGNPMAARLLAFPMVFAIYIVVMMYGQSIMSSVQEEKRDRIVELIVSSIRARDLLMGKVLGIGATGILQMMVWVAAAGIFLAYGATIAIAVGASEGVVETLSQQGAMPNVPLSVGIAFVFYFVGGFFLFATLFALIGAVVTNAQEAQQFVLPVLVPFMLGLFIAMPAAENPHSTVAVIGSYVPFTSPMVMPVRASVTGIPWWELAVSIVLLYATAAIIVWLAAKIYRVAVFATGQKPTARELVRWMRAA
jgi:ABC-2 type transport system permease protein